MENVGILVLVNNQIETLGNRTELKWFNFKLIGKNKNRALLIPILLCFPGPRRDLKMCCKFRCTKG